MNGSINKMPPLMGLPFEAHVISYTTSDFYTCLFGAVRVYVWDNLVNGWYIQLGLNEPEKTLQKSFKDAKGYLHQIRTYDPLTLQSTIYELTSEGNPHARPNPAGTVESDPALPEATRASAVC